MKIFTVDQQKKLIANGAVTAKDHDGSEHMPVVKLFLPGSGCTWLLSELDPDDLDRAFGLCDLGMGEPELGYVSIAELLSVRSGWGLTVERDIWFTPKKTVVEYAAEARAAGRIIA